MPRKERSLVDLVVDLVRLPWWITVVLAVAVFAALRWGVPWVFADGEYGESGSLASAMFAPLASMVSSFAPFAAVLLLPAAWSAFRQWRYGKPESNDGGFESLIAECYRRKGYRVRPAADRRDDGVLRMSNDSGRYLVQCKHWQSDVKVEFVRELHGLMQVERAFGGAVVTYGTFHPAAIEFAEVKGIDLVDGRELDAMIAEAQT